MQTAKNGFETKIASFFNNHPEREFYVADANPGEVREAAQLLWLVGFASQPINAPGLRKPDIHPHCAAVPVVVRRADPAGGQPTPGVIVLDGGMILPAFPSDPKERPHHEEGFGGFVWQAAVETGRAGKSLKEALVATGLIRRG